MVAAWRRAGVTMYGHSGVEPGPAYAEVDPIEDASVDGTSIDYWLLGLDTLFSRLFCCDHESCPTFRSCTLADVTPRLRTWRYHLRPCYPLQGQTTVTSTLGLDTHCSLTPLALGILTLRQARSAAALTGVQRSSERLFRTDWN